MSTISSGNDWNEAWGITKETSGGYEDQIEAFFNLEDFEDETVKKWANTHIPIFKSRATDFTRKAVENLMFYKGIQMGQDSAYYDFRDAHRFLKSNKISLNIVYEFVELWVNRMAKYKATISVTPVNNDSKARDNAEAKELAIKDFIKKNKINQLVNQWNRETLQFGEGFVHVSWDYNKGPIHPEYEKMERRFKSRKRVQTESGHEVNIDREPRIGDVKVEIVPPIYVYYEDKPWDQVEYVILNIPENADKLRSDYPDKNIKGTGEIDCYIMYHLPTKYLQKGRYLKIASEEVLENTDFPYNKPILPVVKMTDIDITGSGRGKSFIENIKAHQVLINECISVTWNNLRRGLKGKWVFPSKTVNTRHLSPESPAIEYVGNIKPEFIAYPTINAQAIEFIKLLREYAEKQARIQGIVQGSPPPNVRSGLQFAQLEEKERESVETPIGKRNSAIAELCEVIITLMAKHYKESDGRTYTIYGKDKEYLTKALKLDAIKEDSPVEVTNDDSMPTGKASKMAFFSDLRNSFGNQVVPDEMMIDMLDSGRFNQYSEFGGATVETTMSQISDILDGNATPDPMQHEDLILKWKLVVGFMRKRAFLSYEEGVKKQFEDFVYAIEDLIINKENKSPIMQEQLTTLQAFPVFYKNPVNEFFQPPVMPMAEGEITEEDITPEEAQAIGIA